MESNMKWDSVQQFIRIGMQMVAGSLVTQGYLTEDVGMQLSAGVVSIAGVVWWYYWNKIRAV